MLICMTANSALLLLIRSFSSALIMLVGKRYFAWYLLGDIVFYFALKIARNDLHYWLPIDGAPGFLFYFVHYAARDKSDGRFHLCCAFQAVRSSGDCTGLAA